MLSTKQTVPLIVALSTTDAVTSSRDTDLVPRRRTHHHVRPPRRGARAARATPGCRSRGASRPAARVVRGARPAVALGGGAVDDGRTRAAGHADHGRGDAAGRPHGGGRPRRAAPLPD